MEEYHNANEVCLSKLHTDLFASPFQPLLAFVPHNNSRNCEFFHLNLHLFTLIRVDLD